MRFRCSECDATGPSIPEVAHEATCSRSTGFCECAGGPRGLRFGRCIDCGRREEVQPAIGEPGICSSPRCRRRILWTLTPKGKRSPVDPGPSLVGLIRLSPMPGGGLPLARIITGAELDESRRAGELLYTTHYATCPDADRFRKRRPTRTRREVNR